MILMTDGLRSLAGEAVRARLMRFTRTPLSGAATGAACTALLQSSSATTVAAVGFVGAGLMSFPNALGIVFGANLGTTLTGWMVALVGFKLHLGVLALPLVFAGALLRLFGRARVASGGLALAGFALIFIGIAGMQVGMQGLETLFDFTALPGDSLFGRLALVGLGIAFTLVTQSSSAAVAATLTALNGGLVDLPQAACLVIGADIGTTVTAGLATVGASLDARRTGLSHVLYNLLTGLLAFALVSPYVGALEAFAPALRDAHPEVALVAFHSGFNALGVLLALPFAGPFARLVERLVPQRAEPRMGLDPALLDEPPFALAAVQQQAETAGAALIAHVNALLGEPPGHALPSLDALQRTLDESHDFIERIKLGSARDGRFERMLALLHALDHLQRLHERCDEDRVRGVTVAGIEELTSERTAFLEANGVALHAARDRRWDLARRATERVADVIAARVGPYRDEVASGMAGGALGVDAGTSRLEAARWLRRVSRHVARIAAYLEAAAAAAGDAEP